MGDVVYHMCQSSVWEKAVSSGKAYVPPTYEQDGFVHLTKDANMLLTVANHFYADDPLDNVWKVLMIRTDRLKDELRYEAAAPVGDKSSSGLGNCSGHQKEGEQEEEAPKFPHLYGPIYPEYVFDTLSMKRDATTGKFLEIEGLSTAS